jgi:uncharacterized NAD(P)/FAD-binding protein YdhS
LIRRDGTSSRRLYALGPKTKGALWEIVGVPDIRKQAAKLAAHLNSIVATMRRERSAGAHH